MTAPESINLHQFHQVNFTEKSITEIPSYLYNITKHVIGFV